MSKNHQNCWFCNGVQMVLPRLSHLCDLGWVSVRKHLVDAWINLIFRRKQIEQDGAHLISAYRHKSISDFLLHLKCLYWSLRNTMNMPFVTSAHWAQLRWSMFAKTPPLPPLGKELFFCGAVVKSGTAEETSHHVWTSGCSSAAAVGQCLPLALLASSRSSDHLWNSQISGKSWL